MARSSILARRRPVALLVVAALMPWPLAITQDHWWAFILASVAILAALRVVLGEQWTKAAGLRLSPAQALLVIPAFLLIAAGSTLLLHHVYGTAGLKADAPSLDDQIGFLFQAFNEEVLFRALLIGLLIQWIPSAPVVSLGAAFFFVVPHFLLYRFSNPMHLALSPGALSTLFFAGVAMNNLYLIFRHIGFSWALHAGWNAVWLPATFYDAATNQRLYEPQVFDRVLGSPVLVATACAVAFVSFLPLARRASRMSNLARQSFHRR